MRMYLESRLPCDADLAWSAVQTSALLREVAAPVVVFRPAPDEHFPERWAVGPPVRFRFSLFGILPMGTQTVRMERIDPQAREIQSRESGPLVRRWDHLIRVQPAPGDSCLYSDEVEIEAGWLTPLVWLFAALFYRHRQRRWQRVARRLSQETKGA